MRFMISLLGAMDLMTSLKMVNLIFQMTLLRMVILMRMNRLSRKQTFVETCQTKMHPRLTMVTLVLMKIHKHFMFSD
jgi:energy-converting hydrogenase Eha subunit H